MSETTVTIGPSGMTLLTIVFVLLKVFHKIDWSWWWVFAPLWLPLVVFLAILSVIGIVMLIAIWLDEK